MDGYTKSIDETLNTCLINDDNFFKKYNKI